VQKDTALSPGQTMMAIQPMTKDGHQTQALAENPRDRDREGSWQHHAKTGENPDLVLAVGGDTPACHAMAFATHTPALGL